MILLKQAREDAKLSQLELSRKSGVPQQTISSIESGARTNPGIETMYALAAALGKKIDDLFSTDERREDVGA